MVQTPVLEKLEVIQYVGKLGGAPSMEKQDGSQGTDRLSGVTRDNVISWLMSVRWTPVSKGRTKMEKCAISRGELCRFPGLEEVSCI